MSFGTTLIAYEGDKKFPPKLVSIQIYFFKSKTHRSFIDIISLLLYRNSFYSYPPT